MFDAVARIEQIESVQGITDSLQQFISSFGFTACLVTGVPEPPTRLEEYILVNGWPDGWSEHYSKSDYYRYDPVATLCRKTSNPFEWSDIRLDAERYPKSAQVMNAARDFGMCEGFLVPIMRTSGYQACVSIAGAKPDLDPDAKRALHVVSMFAHGRISHVQGGRVQKKGVLSPTEREILAWAAHGKTSWEIAEIMEIAKTSVDTLTKRAAAKLDAVNRTQAVVNAIRIREINL